MDLWIITRLKLRTDQMMTHRLSSRDQNVLVRQYLWAGHKRNLHESGKIGLAEYLF